MSGFTSARCSEAGHQWTALDGCRQPGIRREECRECGVRGVWLSAAHLWSEAE